MTIPIVHVLEQHDYLIRPEWPPLPFEPIDLGPKPKILIFKLSALGDCVMTTPAVRALRDRYPQAHITWAVGEPAASLLQNNPHIDEVLVWKGKRWGGLKLLLAIRRAKFDAVVDFQGVVRKGIPIVRWSGARWRVAGLSDRDERAQAAANLLVPLPEPPFNATLAYLRLTSALGADPEADPSTLISLSQEERDWAGAFLRDEGITTTGRPLVALNPGASKPTKQWPPDKFIELGNRLAARGVDLVVLGSPSEVNLAEEIAAGITPRPVLAAGRMNLRRLAALLEKCTLMVTADTGPMHIAGAVGTRTLSLFGPSDPLRTGPGGRGSVVIVRDLPCRPCLKYGSTACPGQPCLKELEVDDVEPAIWRMLERS